MASRRTPRARPTFCPACDAPLDAALATAGTPACPRCATPLVPLRRAPLWRRGTAALVDGAILLATVGPLSWAVLAIVDPGPLLGDARGLDALLRLLELSPFDLLDRAAPAIVLCGVYFVLFWSLTGRTIGQKLMHLRVVDHHGSRLHPLIGLGRYVAKIVGLFAGTLGWVWAAFDVENRAWHDHVARTTVVRDP